MLLRGLQEGNELLLRVKFDVDTALNDIEVKKATVFAGVPTMWIALANVPDIAKRDLSSLRYVASGGAPLPVEVADRFQKLTGHKLGGGWGMTETSPAGTALPRQWTGKAGSVGLPMPGVTIEIVALDDPRRVLGPNEKGEMRIKGLNITKGYWNAPEETATAFVDGWFLTGDIGTMDEDGYIYLVDRKKDMILSGGFNVYPRTIEEAIYEHRSRRGGERDRRAGRLSRRGRQSVRAAQARLASLHAGRAASCSSPTSSASTRCRRTWSSATRCRRRQSASCRRKS